MTELEKKVLLSKDEYDYLKKHIGHNPLLVSTPIVKQINFYFDTNTLCMNRQNITCRVRLKDGQYEGTIKTHLIGSEQSNEKQVRVRNGIVDNAFIDMGLKLQGSLTTYRSVIFENTYCTVYFDKNEYLDTADYELEIEYLPEHEKDAQTICQILLDILTRRAGVLAHTKSFWDRPSVPSKSRRFFNRKSAIQETTKLKRNKKIPNV